MKISPNAAFKVVHWDGSDRVWIDMTGPATYKEAMKEWNRCTDNGTRNTRYADFDYFCIVCVGDNLSDARAETVAQDDQQNAPEAKND